MADAEDLRVKGGWWSSIFWLGTENFGSDSINSFELGLFVNLVRPSRVRLALAEAMLGVVCGSGFLGGAVVVKRDQGRGPNFFCVDNSLRFFLTSSQNCVQV